MGNFFSTFIAVVFAMVFLHFSATVYVSVRKNQTFEEATEQIFRDLVKVTKRDSGG